MRTVVTIIKKITIPSILIFCLLYISISNGCQSLNGDIGIDIVAPDFQLDDINGQTVLLSNLRGSPIILNFWATWCEACREEMPLLQQIYEKWESRGIILLTIDLRESISILMQYMQSNSFSFPVLIDIDGSVAVKYNFGYIPTTFFIDIDGIIKARKFGPFISITEIEKYISEIQYQ